MNKLWQPVSFGRTTLPNRLAMAPMTRDRSTPSGAPWELNATYYAQRASMGLIVTEGTQPSEADLREVIPFEPERKLTFFQLAGPREGAIINELSEDESGALRLRFYCYLGLRDKEPGGDEEQAEQEWINGDEGYRSALLSTLKRTRELLADGKL